MEIEAASLAQVIRGRDGALVEVDDDVQSIARGLRDIDSHFCLRYSEAGEYFVVYYRPEGEPEGNGYVVTTAQELDGRLVDRVREVYHRTVNGSYSYAAELEKADERAEAERQYAFEQKVGDAGERLAHALRKDLGVVSRAVVPRDVPG